MTFCRAMAHELNSQFKSADESRRPDAQRGNVQMNNVSNSKTRIKMKHLSPGRFKAGLLLSSSLLLMIGFQNCSSPMNMTQVDGFYNADKGGEAGPIEDGQLNEGLIPPQGPVVPSLPPSQDDEDDSTDMPEQMPSPTPPSRDDDEDDDQDMMPPLAPTPTPTPVATPPYMAPSPTPVASPTPPTQDDEEDHDDHHQVVIDDSNRGLRGGHIDVQVASKVYAFDAGAVDAHAHAYDDKHHTNVVDMMDLKESGMANVQDAVPSSKVFVVTLANAHLNPGAVIEINGVSMTAAEYQRRVDRALSGGAPLQSLSIGQAGSVAQLSSLKVKYDVMALKQNQVHRTQIKCVVENREGAGGEYRHGALVVQVHALDSIKMDSQMRVSAPNGGLLWEASIFHHHGDGECINESNSSNGNKKK